MSYSIKKKEYTPCWRVSYLRTLEQKLCLLHRATDVSILKYGKCTEILHQNMETRRNPVGQISYSSMGVIPLYNGIAQLHREGSFSATWQDTQTANRYKPVIFLSPETSSLLLLPWQHCDQSGWAPHPCSHSDACKNLPHWPAVLLGDSNSVTQG